MADNVVRFDDGAAYEKMMGVWSRLAGERFIDWLAPDPDLRWIDVGCGNGAFTQLAIERCAPAEIHGIDPSEGQLAFARQRAPAARYHIGTAEVLPFADDDLDIATMALVIFFVPEPIRGVREMARVVRPGGTVAAYAWDMLAGGFPWEPLLAELRAAGVSFPTAPNNHIASIDAFSALWAEAGLTDVESREIHVQRTFADFDEFWRISGTVGAGKAVAEMPSEAAEDIKARVRARLSADDGSPMTLSAKANAVVGRVPPA